MRIDRSAMESALARFARHGDGIIVGSPGAGKTFSLQTLARDLSTHGVLVVPISVEDIGDATELDLHAMLGYASATFERALREEVFPSAAAGTIVFDGFDAARGADVRRGVLRLIRIARTVAPAGWTVVVSVRTYDAQRSVELQNMFQTDAEPAPPQYQLKGVRARHFFIPPLSPVEVADAAATIDGLSALLTSGHASTGLVELLNVPFNLWLVEQLLRANVSAKSIGAFGSEVELLGGYWERYVRDFSASAPRLSVLRRITGALIARRRLSIARTEVELTTTDDSVLAELLSAEVLAESGPHGVRLGYSHNILFDYAVSVLLIDEDAQHVIGFLQEDPSRPLFLRPSITYFFSRLWLEERDRFWGIFWPLMAVEDVPVRLVARIIPALVLARFARSADELMPLFTPAAGGDAPTAVLRALQASRYSDEHTSTVWIEFASRAVKKVDRRFAWELAGVLNDAVPHYAADQDNTELIADSAQRLFQWAWSERAADANFARWFDRFAAIEVLPVVLETAAAAVEGARAIIEEVLDVIEAPEVELRLFYTLASRVGGWVRIAPSLALKFYQLAFAHVEESTAPTEIGGTVLRLVGNRRQDFGMILYSLREAFSKVFEADPIGAATVAFDLLNIVALRDHIRPYLREGRSETDLKETFQFRGRECVYLKDLSAMWWDSPYGGDELDDIVKHVSQEVAKPRGALEPDAVVDALAEHAYAAATWSVLLEIGTAAPSRFGELLRPLLMVPAIVLSADTAAPALRFAAAAAPLWDDGALREVENALLSFSPRASSADAEATLARAVDRMLSQLPSDRLSGVASARARSMPPGAGLSDADSFRVSVRTVPDEEVLAEEGIDLSDGVNARMRALGASLGELIAPWGNESPPETAAAAIEEAVRSALATLEPLTSLAEAYRLGDHSRPDAPERLAAHPHPRLVFDGWTALSRGAEVLARSRPPEDSPRFRLARQILLRASAFPPHDGTEEYEESYRWASWSSEPRTEAIQGLAYLADVAADATLARAVSEFARSAVPSERFLAVRYAAVFAKHLPGPFRELLEDVAKRERNDVILSAFLEGLWYFVGTGNLAASEAGRLVERVVEPHADSDVESFIAVTARWLVYLALNEADPWALKMIRLAAVEGRHLRERRAESLGARLLDQLLAIALPEPASRQGEGRDTRDLDSTAVREERAAELATEIIAASGADAHAIQQLLNARYRGGRAQDDDPDLLRLLARHGLVDAVAWRLQRAASGGFAAEGFERAVPLLDAVVQFSAPTGAGRLSAPTTHHFVEFLSAAVDANPAGVIHYAALFTAAGAPEGYQFDTLAVDAVVRLVEHVLADYRDAVSSGQALTELLQILDLFADQGWPRAIGLVWRLDEVYR